MTPRTERRRHGVRGLRLTLSMSAAPQLLGLPWELLYRRPLFFATQRHTPIVRQLDTPFVPAPPSIDHTVGRILGVVFQSQRSR